MIVPIYFDLSLKTVNELPNLEAILRAGGYAFYVDVEGVTLRSISWDRRSGKIVETLEDIECLLEDK